MSVGVSDEMRARARVAKAKAKYQANSLDIIRDGLFKITTTLTTKDGQIVESDEEQSIIPFYPTDNQNRILDWFEYCQKHRKQVSINCLKKRREGLSTLFQAIGLSRAMTINGYKVVTIAHKPLNSEEIFAIGRRMRRHLPWYFGIPEKLRRDSKEYMEIICGLFGVRESCLQNIPATENIDSAHGQGWNFVHNTEVSRFDDVERYREATSSVLMKGQMSARVNETTSNGTTDQLFYPEFMSNWREQGGANYWERGYRPNKAQSLSVFFPAYTNQTFSTVEIPHFVSTENLVNDFEDYEKWLFNACQQVWLDERNVASSHAVKMALQHVYWRRCKLPSIYSGRDGIGLINPGSDPYPSLEMFHRMEPNTVEEAFEASYLEKPLSPEMVAFLKSGVEYPIRRGVFTPAGAFEERSDLDVRSCSPERYPPLRIGWSIWEELDKTSGDLWVSVDFCEGQVHTSLGDVNWGRDFTVAQVVDYRTGKHVAEYISQRLHSDAALDIWHFLCMCQRMCPGNEFPYVIWESPHGKGLQQLLLKNEYPWDRIYFRIRSEGLVEQTVESMGIYPSPTCRVERVQLGSQSIGAHRFFNRSDLVARQADWFIRRGNKYEAQEKDGHGEEARDDALMAYIQLGYVSSWLDTAGSYLSPVEGIEKPVDGEGFDDREVKYAGSDNIGPWLDSYRRSLAAQESGSSFEYHNPLTAMDGHR